MITIYVSTPQGMIEVQKYEPGCWIHVVNPTEKEISSLIQRFQLPHDFVTDPLDIDERSRIEVEDDIRIVLLRAPRREPENAAIPFITLPIGAILVEDVIITISLSEIGIMNEFIHGRVRNFQTQQRTRFLLQLCYRTTLRYMRYLKEINRMTNTLEIQLLDSPKNDHLVEFFNLQKSLVYFTTSLRTNSLMIEKFHYQSSLLPLTPDEEDLYEEIVIENKQALEMASIYTTILTGMMDVFASMVNNNLNVVLKLLTSITIVLAIPTLIASVYGMNVDLPMQESSLGFAAVMGVTIVTTIASVLLLWRKEMF
ncbi:MAG: magnesium transporter CorA family protein [Methanomicrobiales archaeon]|nr:magnesium transporter CorA family protein [Methanomicrobiales archaeon]